MARLIKKKERRIKSRKLEMKKERLQQTMQKYKGDYYEQLHGNKMDNLEEMDRFLEKFNLSRLNQEEIEIMNNPTTSTEIETVVQNLPKNKSPGTYGFTGEVYQTFREDLMPILLKFFPKIAREGNLPNSVYKDNITLILKSEQQKKNKQTNKKENYRPLSLMNIEGKILKKILTNRIQQYFKKLRKPDQVGFIPEMQGFFNICK